MQITPHFNLSEFKCHDGTAYPTEWIKSKLEPLCKALERVRVEFSGAKITITSGYRTKEYNKKVGGSKNSQHCLGTAADFKVEGIAPSMVSLICEKLIDKGALPQGGVGSYKTWTHYDIRGHKARWDG